MRSRRTHKLLNKGSQDYDGPQCHQELNGSPPGSWYSRPTRALKCLGDFRRFSEIYGDFRRFSEILAPAPNVPKTLTGAANLNQAHGDFGAVPFGLIKLLREYGTPLALASPGALPPGPTAGSSPGSSITTQGPHRETGLVRPQHQNFTGPPSAKRDLRRSLRRRPWRGVWGPLGRANFRSGAAPNVT